MDVKNIEQYVGKFILDELEKQNEELKKLRKIVSQVSYCFLCNLTSNNYYHVFYSCNTCGKIVCDVCIKDWVSDDEYEYCSRKCYDDYYILKT